jgi:hypothetical protein
MDSNLSFAANIQSSYLNATTIDVSCILNVTGNLDISGKMTSTNFSLQELVDYQNLAWRTQFNLNDIYDQAITPNRTFARKLSACLYQVQKYDIEGEYKLLDASGNPTTYLTQNTSWTNPEAVDYYGHAAPLVKIEDNGDLTYIDVSGTSIFDICKAMVPTNCKTFRAYMTSWDKYLKDFVGYGNKANNYTTGQFTVADQMDAHAQYLSFLLKIGIPTNDVPTSGNILNHVFYNEVMEIGIQQNPSIYGEQNMQVGIDINPYLDGSGCIDFFIQGGINNQINLGIRGIDWTGQVVIPPFSIEVTTDSAEYMQKKANNQNSVYLNTALNILNFNIVDFGDYVSYFPNGTYWDPSGTPVPDASNSHVISPKTFNASFGMYRNKIIDVTNTTGLRNINDSNLTSVSRIASTPIICPLDKTEFLVLVSDTIDYTFEMSSLVGLQTVSFTRTHQFNGIDYSTNFVMPQYGMKRDTPPRVPLHL